MNEHPLNPYYMHDVVISKYISKNPSLVGKHGNTEVCRAAAVVVIFILSVLQSGFSPLSENLSLKPGLPSPRH